MAAGFHYPDIYAVKENSEFKRRLPPAESDPEKWEDTAHVIGTSAKNWSAYKFLFKAPDGDLCAVKTDGYFYKGPPPEYRNITWDSPSHSVILNISGWADYQFIFYGPNGDLYAVARNGDLLTAPPPSHPQDNWANRATKIGSGFGPYRFLFFGPDALLYAVNETTGFFFRGPPPTNNTTASVWESSEAVKNIGRGFLAFKFLFFGPGGYLYGIFTNGNFYRGLNPTTDAIWTSLSTTIHYQKESGWKENKFVF
jgi:hypothetical protein